MENSIRDTLFGDLPADSWPSEELSESDPWKTFVSAREHSVPGDTEQTKRDLHQVLAMKDLESRHYLQAWQLLRGLGEQPSAEDAKHLYGVVIEVAFEEGVDLVAAYEDHTARYYNDSGAGVVWEHPNESFDETIDELLSAGREVVVKTGPWNEARPPAPPPGQVRINMLCPSGLHFGQAPYEALSQDPLGGPVLNAALRLMQSLIGTTEES